MLWQEQSFKTRTETQNLTPILTRTGYQYQITLVKGVPMSHKHEIHVHVHRRLGIEGRLVACELRGPNGQLNVINVHVPFGDATDKFLEHLMEAYRQLAMMGPNVIIGDFNAAPGMDERGGQATSENTVVRMAKQHLDLQDLKASLRGQASHRPPQPGSTDSRIDLCYADPTHMEVTKTKYHNLPSKATGHRPLEKQLKVLHVPTAPSDSRDQDVQPPFRPPEEHDTPKWMADYRTVDCIFGQECSPDLNLAMRQPAAACGLHGGGQSQTADYNPTPGATPHGHCHMV